MKEKLKVLKAVLFILLIIIVIIAPIIAREIVDLKKELATSTAYRYILGIEKNNLLKRQVVNDGKNINVNKIKTDIKAKISGKITIKNGLVESANLKVNGYKIDYSNVIKKNDDIIYKYYIDEKSKRDDIDSSWRIYFKEDINNIMNKENFEHLLSYKYKNKKYSFTIDNKRDCKKILNNLSKLPEFSNLSCSIKYNDSNLSNELCVVIDDNETLCYKYSTWNNLSKIKMELENKYNKNIHCTLNNKKLHCRFKEADFVIKKANDINIIINKNKCVLKKNIKVNCS